MKLAPTSIGFATQASQAATGPSHRPVKAARAEKAEAAQAAQAQRSDAAEKAEGPSEATEKTLEALQDKASQALDSFGHSVRIQSTDSGRVVMQIIDKSSGDLVNQFPNEDALALAERLDTMRGILFSAEG